MLKRSECTNKTFLVDGAAGSPERGGIKSIREVAPVTRPLFGLENVRGSINHQMAAVTPPPQPPSCAISQVQQRSERKKGVKCSKTLGKKKANGMRIRGTEPSVSKRERKTQRGGKGGWDTEDWQKQSSSTV